MQIRTVKNIIFFAGAIFSCSSNAQLPKMLDVDPHFHLQSVDEFLKENNLDVIQNVDPTCYQQLQTLQAVQVVTSIKTWKRSFRAYVSAVILNNELFVNEFVFFNHRQTPLELLIRICNSSGGVT